MLRDRLWRGRFAADPNLIGRGVTLDDQVCTVIGYAARLRVPPQATDLWVLLTPNFLPPPDQLPIGIFARLRPGVSIAKPRQKYRLSMLRFTGTTARSEILCRRFTIYRRNSRFLADASLKTTLWVLTGAVTLSC